MICQDGMIRALRCIAVRQATPEFFSRVRHCDEPLQEQQVPLSFFFFAGVPPAFLQYCRVHAEVSGPKLGKSGQASPLYRSQVSRMADLQGCV